MKPLKTRVTITLDSNIVDQTKQIAENDDRSFSQYINLILRKHMENLHLEKQKS